METNKILSALSYFSIFFAGVLFPLIVLLVSTDKVVKSHAKKALLSHLITLIPVPFIIFSAVFGMLQLETGVPVVFITSIIACIIISLIVLIWNIVKGIQVLSKETL